MEKISIDKIKACVYTIFDIILSYRRKLMSKNNKSDVEVSMGALKQRSAEDVPVEQPVYTRFMVGTYIDPLTGEWMLAYAKFNPLTKQMDFLQTERVAGDREVMRERLTIKQAQLGLYDAAPVVGNGKLEEIY